MEKGFSLSAVWMAVVLSGSGLALLLTLAVPAHSQTPTEASLPEGNGKELVETVCDQCHGLKEVTDLRKTAQQWRDIVTDMVSQGAPMLDDEIDVAVEYLAKNFGPGKTPAAAPAASDKVNVNKATAKELETGLEISEKEAEAVVQYREKKGNFGKWEDLKKVPGLDAAKIEQKKDRLTF